MWRKMLIFAPVSYTHLGKKILENLREVTGDNVSQYLYHEYIIPASSLHKGIKYYDIALRIYMGAVLKRVLKRDRCV